MRDCFAIASDRLLPSITSWRNCWLISCSMPLDFKCPILLRARVKGIPEWIRLASCCVQVASSCNFGLRWQLRMLRKKVGKALERSPLPFLAALRLIGWSPERSI